MRRQRGAGLVGRPLAPCRRDAGGFLSLFDEQLGFGHRHVAIFERQRELTAVDLFRSLAEVHAVERSEEHTSELQSLMRISYAVFCLKKKTIQNQLNRLSTAL